MSGFSKTIFAGFQIVEKLGEGGMATVYKATQIELDRVVALKVIDLGALGDPTFAARSRREGAAAASLDHPNIVRVFSAGQQDGVYYIAMEFVEGETLGDHIERRARLDAREAIAITVRVAMALGHAWRACRLVHRDVKPDNVFLSRQGEVKLGDFGLAKRTDIQATPITAAGTVMGSPYYMSPEQACGTPEADHRTDIYSLGCTLYHMLAGEPPFPGKSAAEVVHKHVNEPPPSILRARPDCPPQLATVVGRMLAKDREKRPGDHDALVDELWDLHAALKRAGER